MRSGLDIVASLDPSRLLGILLLLVAASVQPVRSVTSLLKLEYWLSLVMTCYDNLHYQWIIIGSDML